MDYLQFIFQAINNLLTQNLGFFDAMGQNLFRSFATILVVWYGVKTALSSASGKHFLHFDNFASLLLTISFGFGMVNYYSAPIPGVGTSFHNIITDESQFLANKINLDEALKDEDQSIQAEERYDNLMNKSKILDAMNRKDDATVARNQALDKASPLQLYFYGRQLQTEKKPDEAFALYRSNAKKFPDYWTSHMGLARVYSSQGDFDNAVKEVKLSLAGAPDSNKANLEGYVKRLQNKEDINR